MKPSNYHFEKELLQGPLKQKGFTDELRRKIERKAEQQTKLIRPYFQLVSAICFVLFLAVGGLLYHGSAVSPDILSSVHEQQIAVNNVSPTIPAIAAPASGHSGLLLGLRADDAATGTSAYRTIYITQEGGQVHENAGGAGILVPYKQKFWMIDTLTQETAAGGYQSFVSRPADQQTGEVPTMQYANEEINHSEKLMFVGNQYVSIAATERNGNGENSADHTGFWVTQIPLLQADRLIKNEPAHVKLAELNGMDDLLPSFKDEQNWTLVREQGQWVPKIAKTSLADNTQRYLLQDLPVTLPESVISHDDLCCSWQEISAKQFEAVDALSSPDHHLVAIFTEDQISFYTRQSEIADVPELTIELKPGESLIMAQWATGQYVDIWTKQISQFWQ